jgi:hypothetical protein
MPKETANKKKKETDGQPEKLGKKRKGRKENFSTQRTDGVAKFVATFAIVRELL